ncbi:hypothetical protein D3C73_1013880 [compost metagenome]
MRRKLKMVTARNMVLKVIFLCPVHLPFILWQWFGVKILKKYTPMFASIFQLEALEKELQMFLQGWLILGWYLEIYMSRK